MIVTVFGYLIVLADISTILVFFFSSVLVSMEKLYLFATALMSFLMRAGTNSLSM